MASLEYKRAKTKMVFSFIFLAFGVIYIISPIDLIPDILGPVGWVDDIAVLLITVINSVVAYNRLQREEKNIIKNPDRIER